MPNPGVIKVAKVRLGIQERAFAENYLDTFRILSAMKAAGYVGSDDTLRTKGYLLLQNDRVRSYIQSRMEGRTLKDYEILDRLSQQATASVADFFEFDDLTGQIIGLNNRYLQEHGHLVKKLIFARGTWTVELYDGQAALMALGKYAGVITERLSHSGSVNQTVTQVQVYLPDNGRGDRV